MKELLKSHYRGARAWLLSRGLQYSGDFALSPDERKASSQFSVVVPVHDGLEVAFRCLVGLRKFAGNAEVVIVDDASSQAEVKEMLKDFCGQNNWRLITNQRAMGHSRASEAGVTASSRPFVCLLNSDAIVSSKSWLGMLKSFESSPKIAVAGPSTSYTVGPQTVTRACHCRHYWSNEQIWRFAEKYVAGQEGKPILDVPYVGGFAFFVRRSVWDSLGGFDPKLPDYGNEMEFCKRVVRAGLQIAWAKNCYIHHLGNASYGKSIGIENIRSRSLQATLYSQMKHGE